MARRKKPRSSRRRPSRHAQSQPMLLSRRNYVLILIGVAMIVVGFLIMWIEHEVDGFFSLYVAPFILMAGYLEIIYALLWRPKEERQTDVSLEEVLEQEPEEQPV